jgi:hypothetical protein
MSAEMAEQEEDELELVQHTRWMSTETFARHMEARHPESLAGVPVLWFSSDYVEKCYRAFHRQLHRFLAFPTHRHEED